MEQVDTKIIDGFRLEVTQQLAESVEFAVNALVNNGENDPEEHRQAAQEALVELLTGMPEATIDAYRRSPLKHPDLEAVAHVFKNLAIRAKLIALCGRSPEHPDMFPTVEVVTRKRTVTGVLCDMGPYEGTECIHLTVDGALEFIPVVSIQELHA